MEIPSCTAPKGVAVADKRGAPAQAWDFVVHEETVAQARGIPAPARSPPFFFARSSRERSSSLPLPSGRSPSRPPLLPRRIIRRGHAAFPVQRRDGHLLRCLLDLVSIYAT